jgi:hypothetical protein
VIRRREWATRALYAFGGVELLLSCAVAGMAIRMWVRDDPAVTLPLLMISTCGAATILALYATLLRVKWTA